MNLLKVNNYLEYYDDAVVFFIEEITYKYRKNLFKSNVRECYYFDPNKLTKVLKS